MPVPQQIEPPAVKVFGVIHLIFAGLGFIAGLWNLASFFFAGMLSGFQGSANASQMQMQIEMQMELRWVSLMTAIFMIGLAVLLLVSGLKLVRSDPGGIPWSNRYAWTSIATKLVSMVVAVGWVVPKTKAMMEHMMTGTGMPAGAGQGMANAMGGFMSVSSVLTPVLSCTYPVLALYFLSRPSVKEWSASRRAPSAL
jgi:hypothetical protein